MQWGNGAKHTIYRLKGSYCISVTFDASDVSIFQDVTEDLEKTSFKGSSEEAGAFVTPGHKPRISPMGICFRSCSGSTVEHRMFGDTYGSRWAKKLSSRESCGLHCMVIPLHPIPKKCK